MGVILHLMINKAQSIGLKLLLLVETVCVYIWLPTEKKLHDRDRIWHSP